MIMKTVHLNQSIKFLYDFQQEVFTIDLRSKAPCLLDKGNVIACDAVLQFGYDDKYKIFPRYLVLFEKQGLKTCYEQDLLDDMTMYEYLKNEWKV